MARPAQPGQYEGPLPGGRRRCDGVAMQILAGLAITLGFAVVVSGVLIVIAGLTGGLGDSTVDDTPTRH